MDVAAGQTARPPIAGNFTTAAGENQHPRPAKRAIVGRAPRVGASAQAGRPNAETARVGAAFLNVAVNSRAVTSTRRNFAAIA
jgi:hypothetical protein